MASPTVVNKTEWKKTGAATEDRKKGENEGVWEILKINRSIGTASSIPLPNFLTRVVKKKNI